MDNNNKRIEIVDLGLVKNSLEEVDANSWEYDMTHFNYGSVIANRSVDR